jgi:hypothetical protein
VKISRNKYIENGPEVCLETFEFLKFQICFVLRYSNFAFPFLEQSKAQAKFDEQSPFYRTFLRFSPKINTLYMCQLAPPHYYLMKVPYGDFT